MGDVLGAAAEVRAVGLAALAGGAVLGRGTGAELDELGRVPVRLVERDDARARARAPPDKHL